ncbi:2-dehydropantoate 2-reductase [Bombilactobacillus bombi]|uniref:2-dehydropantoate 2-reductase n=1 Tax=Bombilactobacillus bombi TaxID=1303590 RepID=UPI0015E5B300|nr:2-dehydropantoate 2-reductase [Bombilactobacillus bombi]MBA1435129.1 2-dehydropantoate 2-reductase [Bombilactobacillus bombi]
MKIAIVGAGAMGSRFALMLHQSGNQVILIDGWLENVRALQQRGLQANIDGQHTNVKIPAYDFTQLDQLPDYQADLIIAFTKSNQLDKAFSKVRPLISPQTYVLCLLNGIGHEDILEKYVPVERLILGITMWTAGLTGPGQVTLIGSGNVELQNFDAAGKEFTLKVAEVFSQAGLNPQYSTNVKYSIWRKACVNGTLNCLCSILGCNIGALGKTSQTKALLQTIIAEFAAVAAHEGVVLDQTEVYHHIAQTFTADIANHYPSMYQDLIANHRLTEIDFINGAVWRKGQKYGIATPYCALLTELIHAKEELLK